jgi:hypothetical protein
VAPPLWPPRHAQPSCTISPRCCNDSTGTGFVKTVYCDSCLRRKGHSSYTPQLIWGPLNVHSPHGLRYYLLVIDHHTNYMWVRFLKPKGDTCSELESFLLEIRHTHARYHSSSRAFALVLKFDSDSVFEAAVTRQMCGRLGVGVQYTT